MKKYTPVGPAVVIKVVQAELLSAGGIVIGTEGSREAMAREEAVILAVGEEAFEDLRVAPKVGDRVAIARYDGKIIEEGKDYTIRYIADNRISVIIEDSNE